MNNEQQIEKKKYPMPFNIRISDVLKIPLQEMAEVRGRKVSELIKDALEEYVNKHYKKTIGK